MGRPSSELLERLRRALEQEQIELEPAMGVQIEKVKGWLRSIYPQADALFADYYYFLQKTNGFQYGSVLLYSANEGYFDASGIYLQNRLHQEDGDDADGRYLFFGENNIAGYCFDLIAGRFVELGSGEGGFLGYFDSMGDMLCRAMKDALEIYDEL